MDDGWTMTNGIKLYDPIRLDISRVAFAFFFLQTVHIGLLSSMFYLFIQFFSSLLLSCPLSYCFFSVSLLLSLAWKRKKRKVVNRLMIDK